MKEQNRIISYIYVLGFLGLLLIPLCLYPVISEKLDHENRENRRIMTWEEVRKSDWKALFPNLEIWLEDHTLYKNEGVRLIAWGDEHIFRNLYSEKVLVGKDHWLFYKGEKCIQDYRGGYLLTEDELSVYAKAANELRGELAARDIELYLLVTPNKEAVYGDEFMPEYVKRITDDSRADQVVDYLQKNTECTVVYPKDSLNNCRKQYKLWRKYDTHWNDIGAFIATQDFLKATKQDYVSLEHVDIIENGKVSGDLANMLGMGARFSDDESWGIEGYLPEIQAEMIDVLEQPNLWYAKFVSDADNEECILFIGDSFLGSMEQFLAKNYRESLFVHRDNYTALERDLLAEEKPSIIVMQTAERFIGSYADVMNQYKERFAK